MKNLILSFTILLSSLTVSANENNPKIYGYWLNTDSEILLILTDNTFSRRSKSDIIAQGELVIDKNNISVLRTDTGEEYTLEYFLGEETLVVKKPNSDQAWLFTKIGN
ncbi:MAG: hypothetical protein HOC22_03690 [Cryomorphaceae bacterium]|jgi:hypothetical protein|nr:hypothetical protein [Cryomorphaceae bacterium]MBT3689400.1 hypothetical protein [Cryomorphaceae bacterium]MBT4221868.1 hypothetical protein [Cryomorphaceae bacterium]MBT4517771.1 hypothetical protein [Cryomorphaceae bacterium]MBT4834101.1 hypothetical protein [Cryomorphaceae bacterium]